MNMVPFFLFEAGDQDSALNGREAAASIEPQQRRYRLVVDVGHQKTSVVLFKGERLVAARTIRMAGRYVTEFLAKNLGVTYGEAQRIKHAVSRIETSENAKAEAGREREFLVARLMGVAVSELVREVARTVYSFAAQEKTLPEVLFVSGGTSVIQGFRQYLEAALGVPVKPFSFQSDKLIIDEDLEHKTDSMIQALALGLRGVHHKRQSQINLRRGELALVGSYDKLITQISNVGIIVASLVLCLFVSYLVKLFILGSEIDVLKSEYRDAVKKTLKTEPADLSKVAAKKDYSFSDYSSKSLKIIESEIRESDDAVKYFMERQSVYPLRVLEEISKIIPKQIATDGADEQKAKGLIVDVLEFTVQGRSLNIEGETDSRASAETIGSLLKAMPSLQAVNLTASAKTGSEKIIKFRVQASLKEAL